ncbi:MAG TPA: DUF4136 domain-containing protein [Gammaproteobacteria bacterium]|nr:DUF4136 domain-containing protein [Gammaproteobacteria bacterium]
MSLLTLLVHPIFRLPALLLLTFLSGCTTETTVSSRFPPMAPAVLSVSEPGTKIPTQARFAWLPESLEFHADPRFQGAKIDRMVEGAIRQSLARRNYLMQDNAAGADYLLAYVAALENDLDDKTIMQRFGIVPGIAANSADSQQMEKGTLVIYAVDTRTGRRIWRSALQIMVTLEMDDAARQPRINAAVESMFATLPGSH